MAGAWTGPILARPAGRPSTARSARLSTGLSAGLLGGVLSVVTACGGAQSTARTAPAARTAASTQAPASVVPGGAGGPAGPALPGAGTDPQGSPLPPELVGSWASPDAQLVLTPTSYTVTATGAPLSGRAVTRQDVVYFFAEPGCAAPAARYEWHLAAGEVHFLPVGGDGCPRAALLADQVFRRSG